MTTSKKKLPEIKVGTKARVIRTEVNTFNKGDIVVCVKPTEFLETSRWARPNTTKDEALWDWRAGKKSEIEPIEEPVEEDDYYFVPVGEKFQLDDLLLNKYDNTWKTTNCHLHPKLKVWDYGIVKRKKETKMNNTNTREVVVFNLHCGSSQTPQMSSVLFQVFGLSVSEAMDLANKSVHSCLEHKPPEITCTLEQFARFLILRNEAGLQNGFKTLKAKIVHLEKKNESKQIKVDVTGNEDRVEI